MIKIILKYIFLFVLPIIITSCAPAISTVKYNTQVESKPPTCQVDTYIENQNIDKPVKVLGEIRVDDTGFSVNCNAQTVHNIIRSKACDAGADAVQIFNVRHPDFWSTCYRASARFLKYTSKSGSDGDEQTGSSSGTAWVSEYGFIITNYHVVQGKKKLRLIKHDGNELTAKLYIRDQVNDIALLTVDDVSKLPLGLPLSKMPAKLGSIVLTIGYPHPDILGSAPKLNNGIISGLSGLQDDPRTYQISIPVQSGNSGGPLLNLAGEVVGIVTYKLNAVEVFRWTGDLPENVNYAVKSNYLEALFSNITDKNKHSVIDIESDTIEGIGNRVKDSILLIVAE